MTTCKYCHLQGHSIDKCPTIVCRVCKAIGHPGWLCTASTSTSISAGSKPRSRRGGGGGGGGGSGGGSGGGRGRGEAKIYSFESTGSMTTSFKGVNHGSPLGSMLKACAGDVTEPREVEGEPGALATSPAQAFNLLEEPRLTPSVISPHGVPRLTPKEESPPVGVIRAQRPPSRSMARGMTSPTSSLREAPRLMTTPLTGELSAKASAPSEPRRFTTQGDGSMTRAGAGAGAGAGGAFVESASTFQGDKTDFKPRNHIRSGTGSSSSSVATPVTPAKETINLTYYTRMTDLRWVDLL